MLTVCTIMTVVLSHKYDNDDVHQVGSKADLDIDFTSQSSFNCLFGKFMYNPSGLLSDWDIFKIYSDI